jgi:hypothetical protein
MNSSTGFGTMLKNGLLKEAPVKWTAYLPPACALTEYRLYAEPMFLPNSTAKAGLLLKSETWGTRLEGMPPTIA